MRSEPAVERSTPFDVFATRMMYVVAFGVASVPAAQTDIWWLLRAGKDIWHDHHVSLVDRYSFTAYGSDWPNHEWLWEVVAYVLHSIGGMPLLSATVGLSAAATVVALRNVSTARGYVVPIVVAAAVPLLAPAWTIRPQVASLLFYALLMLLLARGRVWWIPLLFLVWANVHGQVVTGGALMVVATIAAIWYAVRDRSPANEARARTLVVVTALSGALTLVTPLGFGLWTYLATFKSRPGPGNQQIREWTSAFELTPLSILFWTVLAGVVVLVVARARRLEGWHGQVPAYAAVAALPFAVLAIRGIPLFAAAAVPLVMTLLEFRTSSPIGTVRRAWVSVIAFAAVVVATVAFVWAAAPSRLGWRPVDHGLADALRACPGRLYNDFNAGAPLVWWVPQVKVFVDNRRDPYPRSVVDASSDLDASTYEAVFERWDIQCALVDVDELLAPALLDAGWNPSYEFDGVAVLVPPSS